MFSRLTELTSKFAHHRFIAAWLFVYAFFESQFFPVPPDVLLIALALARPAQAQRFALLTAVASVLGGLLGYMIGRYAFEPIAVPVLNWFCDSPQDLVCPDVFVPKLKALFAEDGAWVVAASAVSAIIPYKFTILAAGVAHMALTPFIAVSFIVHWFRYALVCFLVVRYGQKVVNLVQNRLPLVFTVVGTGMLVIYALIRYF